MATTIETRCGTVKAEIVPPLSKVLGLFLVFVFIFLPGWLEPPFSKDSHETQHTTQQSSR